MLRQCLVLGLTKANAKLSIKRPPGDLISATSLINLSTHMALVFGCQLFIFVETTKQPGYYQMDNPDHKFTAWEATSLAMFNGQRIPVRFV